MDKRIDVGQPVVDLRQHLESLAEIGKVGLHERAIVAGRRHGVDVEHLVAVFEQVFHASAADLAAAAGHNHARH